MLKMIIILMNSSIYLKKFEQINFEPDGIYSSKYYGDLLVHTNPQGQKYFFITKKINKKEIPTIYEFLTHIQSNQSQYNTSIFDF